MAMLVFNILVQISVEYWTSVEIELLMPDTLPQSARSFQFYFQYVGGVVHRVCVSVLDVMITRALVECVLVRRTMFVNFMITSFELKAGGLGGCVTAMGYSG
uniref:Uncharacterized protein n=1 Tax=Cucumis melo TaxID=3656 RepID=A0A9I9EMU9_CUCME